MKSLLPTHIASFFLACMMSTSMTGGQEPETAEADARLADYFQDQTTQLKTNALADIDTLQQWNARRESYRSELLEMLGLSPLPEKTALKAEITGRAERDDIIVENIHFQSRPGLYVTGNLYRPKTPSAKRLPAILYVCGHGGVKRNGVSYGNKTHYQHHGAWFARNGYVCLTIDTLQLGEIEGIHHGTYRENRFWWLNRGYTSAGVEAWNCVRSLDYLQSRDDVDAARMGVTGRSGGGAYSWWIAAIDERIRCAVPVAGITDLTNHVVDGCVEGHCDCMYMVNTHRWDYAKVAALVAPRPLLISNTDTDRIFPLDGVYRIFQDVRRIYALHDAAQNCALNITAGGHKDTQELRVHAFRWLNHHLKGSDDLIRMPAEKLFDIESLKVFDSLPDDERNTSIDETFVASAVTPAAPDTLQQWNEIQTQTIGALRAKCFAAWPKESPKIEPTKIVDQTADGLRLTAYDFTSQDNVDLRLFIVAHAEKKPFDLAVLNVLDQDQWDDFTATYASRFPTAFGQYADANPDDEAFAEARQMHQSFDWAMAYVAPRGVGLTQWNQDPKKQIQIRRRFYLLGQSVDSMRVFDVLRTIDCLRTIESFERTPLWLQSHRAMAGVTLYASLFARDITRVDLHQLPTSHRSGPFFLNVSRFTTMPLTLAIASGKTKVVLYDDHREPWKFALDVAARPDWNGQLQVRSALSE